MKSILNWDLWQRSRPSRKIDTEYKHKKENFMEKFEVCLGVGLNQIFPEYITIELHEDVTQEDRVEILAEISKLDQEISTRKNNLTLHNRSISTSQETEKNLKSFLNPSKAPCNFDHNGECNICDCWPDACAYRRYLDKDYSIETRKELEDLFKNKTSNEPSR